MKEKKIVMSVRVSKELHNALKEQIKIENRTLSNLIETILKNYIVDSKI